MAKKTVKISDVNKEIVEEIAEEKKAKEISNGIENINKYNDLSKSVESLLNITTMLDKRIDMLREDYDNLKNRLNRVDGRG